VQPELSRENLQSVDNVEIAELKQGQAVENFFVTKITPLLALLTLIVYLLE